MGRISVIEYQKALARNPERLRRLRDDYITDTGDQSMLSFEEMEKYLSDPEKYFQASFSRRYAVGLSLMNIFVKLEVLPTLHWCICRHHGSTPFVTSDCPVVAFALPWATSRLSLMHTGFRRNSRLRYRCHQTSAFTCVADNNRSVAQSVRSL